MDESWTLDLDEPDLPGRLLAATGAVIALFGFWELVLRPWPAPLAAGGLPLLMPGLVALGLGIRLLSAAVIGTPQAVTVDSVAAAVIVTSRVPLLGPVRRRIPFARIATVTVGGDEDSGLPRRLRLCLILHGPRWPVCLATRPSARRADTEALARRLRASVEAGVQGSVQARVRAGASSQRGRSATESSTTSA